MKFEELKNSLKTNLYNAYWLNGVDEYLLSSAYNLILKYSNVTMLDLNLIKFTEGIIDFDDVIRAMDTMPVFCDKKIVYLDLRMYKKSDLKNFKNLDSYMTNPNNSTILIINTGANNEIFVFDKKYFKEVDCNRLGYNIVSLKIKQIANLKNKLIGECAIKLLFDYKLGDLAKINLEMDKLIQYVGDRSEITEDDIKELVTPNLEYQIFELTEALAKKNSEKVFAILNDIKFKKDEFRSLPAIIMSHFRRLFMVSISSDLSNLEISKMLGVKEYAIKMTMAQVKLFSKSNLKKINELCNKLDYDLKQSNISIENAVNLIVLKILNM